MKLTDFIDAIEVECGRKANSNDIDMQKGDVPATWADTTRLKELTGHVPQTEVAEGIRHFVG